MATYITKKQQNIWDVSTELYGSIEGVFDLLISNKWLSLSSEIDAGTELEYHDYFSVNSEIKNDIAERKMSIVNGERSVYFSESTEYGSVVKESDSGRVGAAYMIVLTYDEVENAKVEISYTAQSERGCKVVVDYEDGYTVCRSVSSRPTSGRISHTYAYLDASHRVLMRLDGECVFSELSIMTANCSAVCMVVRPVNCQSFASNASLRLEHLSLLRSFNKAHLTSCDANTVMLPLARCAMLTQVRLDDFSAGQIEEYLQDVIDNYGTRPACNVTINTHERLTDRSMELIAQIKSEPEWNAPTAWVFNVNNTII